MKLIDKDVLVAEIEKLKADALQKKSQCKRSGLERIMHQIGAYNKIISFIDTLEVKEVDLEKEIKEQSNKYYNQCEKKLQEMDDNDNDISFLSLDNYAKYFYELGLKTQKGK